MKRLLISILLVTLSSICMAQILVNVRIDMENAKFDDMDEVELKVRDHQWTMKWDDVVKPAIFLDIVKLLNKREKGQKEYGDFPKTRYELLISNIEMDEDGETTAIVSFNDTKTGEVLFSKEYQEDGDETEDFTRITSKSLKAIVSAASKRLAKLLN